MSRGWALGAGLSVLLAIAAAGWLTREAAHWERAEAAARGRNSLEQDVSVALWRMYSALAPILAREAGRPYYQYAAFHPAERAYNGFFAEQRPGAVLLPSPLLVERPAFVKLHFQYDALGRVSSPQAPTGNARDVAEGRCLLTPKQVDAGTAALRAVELAAPPDELAERLPPLAIAAPSKEAALPPLPDAPAPAEPPPQKFAGRGELEFQRRENATRRGFQYGNAAPRVEVAQAAAPAAKQKLLAQEDVPIAQNIDAAKPDADAEPPTPAAVEGAFVPLWFGERLLVARRVRLGAEELLQGYEVDWPALRTLLLEEVRDLFPAAELQPATGFDDEERGRLLAALPVRLNPGAAAPADGANLSPLRWSLAAAWCGLAAALVALGALLVGALQLGERRGAFVSSVTHELRTPLTTFRVYTEMLSEGMVRDEATRKGYLQTLHAEANRLSHLVENVLSYARLERGRDGGRREDVAFADLLARVEPRLRQRCEAAAMVLCCDACKTSGAAGRVRVDPIAVEQILFNLIDNACKYAKDAADRRVELAAAPGPRNRLRVTVRDHGPGIRKGGLGAVFQRFRKSAAAAAESAPGVGLGLALSRRLARRMGGDLSATAPADGGACFVLLLPRLA